MGVTYIKRRAYSSSASEGNAIELSGVSVEFAKGIYERISNITDNKTLTTPTDTKNQFEQWLLDMNNLYNKKYYPELTADLPEPSDAIVSFDEYLGGLGLKENYPYTANTYSSEPWISTIEQTEMNVPEYESVASE